MPKVDFKKYQSPAPPRDRLPSDLEVIVASYGPYLTLEQAAKCLHKCYGTVYGFVRSGELSSSRTGHGGGYLIAAAEIVRFMKKWSARA